MQLKRLGVIVPSSNTVVEPVMARILSRYPDVAMHVSRLRVTRIGRDGEAESQFSAVRLLEAATLLSDAGVDMILWSGTASSWLGFDRDRALTARIQSALSIPATTAVLTINAALERSNIRRIGLVTPYVSEVEADIIRNYRAIGIDVVSARRCDLAENQAFARVSPERLERMIRDVAAASPDGVVVMCTNLDGASIAERLSAQLGVPVIDSVGESTLHSLALLGRDTTL